MKTNTNGYRGYRFPREIISLCVWLYHRFPLSFRDVEELLAKRGIVVSYETIRQWCHHHYLWRAVDQDGDLIVFLVQRYRNARAAKRFFRKLLKGQESSPWRLVTDKLKSYGAARRSIMPSVDHSTVRYGNNRVEVSHQPTRQRERQMRGFKSAGQALRFLSVQGIRLNFFRFARHQMRSENYRLLRTRSFNEWSAATGARANLAESCFGFTRNSLS